jgi:hypothetical protein
LRSCRHDYAGQNTEQEKGTGREAEEEDKNEGREGGVGKGGRR